MFKWMETLREDIAYQFSDDQAQKITEMQMGDSGADDSLSGAVGFCEQCGQELQAPVVDEEPPVPRSQRWTGFIPGLHDDL